MVLFSAPILSIIKNNNKKNPTSPRTNEQQKKITKTKNPPQTVPAWCHTPGVLCSHSLLPVHDKVKKLIPHPFCCCSILPKFMGPTIMV
jgi:hypothetical protein